MGGAGGASVPSAGGRAPTYAPTFSAIFSEILSKNTEYSCDSPCHALTNMRVDVDPKTTYSQIIDVPASGMGLNNTPGCGTSGMKLIVPGKPEESLLYLKVQAAPPCGERMRIGGPYLNDRELEQIKQWIQMGAQNN
jgi:hypothetical protein